MEFWILGPVEVRADGRATELGGVMARALLTVLLLHANESVSAERLALALWGEDAPAGAVKTVQVYVSRLRRALDAPDLLATTQAGYQLRVRPGELDAARFDQRVAAGQEALAAGEPARAAAALREALQLWRGPALSEFAALPFAASEITRLEEQHLAALELRIEADLAMGRHAELIGELQQLTSAHPWRERLHAQLMMALYRSGRQADALDAYREGRRRLVDELGLEPSPALQRLEQEILAHSAALEWSPAPSAHRARHVPVLPNRTIGRSGEIDVVAGRLRDGAVRLLTLTGPGGVGKTRLAIEVAREVEADFADAAYFVSLAALRSRDEIPSAIIETLAIIALPDESHEQAIARFLAAKHVLLVLDNFEHVLPGAAFVSALLDGCPGMTVLATSREPLNVSAEQRHPVPPLALPPAGALADGVAPADSAAVALFVERARARDPTFRLGDGTTAAVAEICRRVDGLPLAIELAAARCGLLSAAEIAERLDAALEGRGAGARDAPARQQTLRATIDWSHQLLDATEQEGFARFSVFAGGATLDAAQTITGADLDALDGLVSKSLLVRRPQHESSTRLAMLETIRAFAAERLAHSVHEQAVRERHYRYFLAFAEEHGNDRAIMGRAGKDHVARLDLEIDNVHAALAWAVGGADARRALTMCKAIGPYWRVSSRYTDAVRWIDVTLDLPEADTVPALRAWVLCDKALSLRPLGRTAEQAPILAEAEALARAQSDPLTLSHVLCECADQHAIAGREDAAAAFADEALVVATAAADAWAIATATRMQAIAAATLPDLRARVDRAAALLDAVGNVAMLANVLSSAVYVALQLDAVDDARAFADRAMPIVRALDNPFLTLALSGNVGLVALLGGECRAAEHAFREELSLCRSLVVRPFAREGLMGLAAVNAQCGDPDRAARLAGASGTHRYGDPEGDVIAAMLDARFFQATRTRHGPAAWDAAAREGEALTFEDAIAYALDEQRAEISEAASTA